MHGVFLYEPGTPQAEFCIDDRGRRDVLINLELYRAALESARKTVHIYNDTVGKSP